MFKMKFSRYVGKPFLYRSRLFQILIIFDRFEVIVNNPSNPCIFKQIIAVVLFLYPQEGSKIYLKAMNYIYCASEFIQFLKIWCKSVE